jgi:hypothetical protein
MPSLNIGLIRSQTQPGDMLIRINEGTKAGSIHIRSTVVTALSHSKFVHGGIAAGQNRIIEVNGFLSADTRGKGRIGANIYMSDLFGTDLRRNSYVVYRCRDKELGQQVAIEAYPFVHAGTEKSWGYNLPGAIKSILGKDKQDTGSFNYIDENESVLSVAQHENKSWFCSQWMVWMYEKTAEKMRKGVRVGLRAKDAFPGALVEALDHSPDFTFEGVIKGTG